MLDNGLSQLEQKFGGSLVRSSMHDTDYKDRNVMWLRFKKAECPFCHESGWCLVNVTGTKVICMRVQGNSKIQVAHGWLHKLGNNYQVSFDPNAVIKRDLYPLAKPAALDLMNRMVLAAFPLTDKHRNDLRKRGLTDEGINLHGDRGFGSYYELKVKGNNTFPYFRQLKFVKDGNNTKVVSRWENELGKFNLSKNLWHGVPGFYSQTINLGDGKHAHVPYFVSAAQGMLVPYYNIYNQLVGFQTRVDHIKKYAKIIKPLKLNSGFLKVNIDDDDNYIVKLEDKQGNSKVIAHGALNGQKVITNTYGYDVMKEEYSFKVKQSQKYLWVSSSNRDHGGADNSGKTPVEVSYNSEIARLNPNNQEDLAKIKSYIQKPKAIWVTEGGLKSIVATDNLSKQFSKEDLDKYGRDFLGVAGVNSYYKILPILKELHVTTVTTAYDMDMLQNDQVAENYKSLVNMLKHNGFKVQLAGWNPDEAKGIDDALISDNQIKVKDF